MIFSPQSVRRIIEGRKTQTRRPVTNASILLNDGRRVPKPCFYKADHDYAVQPGRGRPAQFRIKILAIHEEFVGQITLAGARAEGFRTTDEFKLAWVRLHDPRWIQRELVDLAAAFDDEVSVVDWILLERFRRNHADKRVRVITFELVRDPSRFLATQRDILSGRSDGDYTDHRNRAIDEAEVLGPDEHAKLHGNAAERLEAARREPLAWHVANLRRELADLRANMSGEGLQDARLRRVIDQIEFHVGVLEKRQAA